MCMGIGQHYGPVDTFELYDPHQCTFSLLQLKLPFPVAGVSNRIIYMDTDEMLIACNHKTSDRFWYIDVSHNATKDDIMSLTTNMWHCIIMTNRVSSLSTIFIV